MSNVRLEGCRWLMEVDAVWGRPRVRLDGYREDGLGQQRDDGGSCAIMHER